MTGGPLASAALLFNQGNLHLINKELKSIVILIKGTGLDFPLFSTPPESGLGFLLIFCKWDQHPFGLSTQVSLFRLLYYIHTAISAYYWPLSLSNIGLVIGLAFFFPFEKLFLNVTLSCFSLSSSSHCFYLPEQKRRMELVQNQNNCSASGYCKTWNELIWSQD